MSKVRIGDLIHRHKELIKVEDDITYKQVTIRVKHKGVVLRGTQQGSAIGTKNQYVARQGQFILSRIDARQGAFGVVPPELEGAIITNDFWCFDINEERVLRDFFYTLIQAPDFDEACKKASIGTTNRQRINEDFFLNYELEIPPLADQQAAVQQIAAARQHLGQIDNELTHQATLLTRMRQAVLREAVQGRLVPQDATEEPASALLTRIRAEKQRLVKEKKLRADKPLQPLNEIEAPYEVPKGWAWCRGEEIVDFVDPQPSHRTPPVFNGGIPYIGMGDIAKDRTINLIEARKVHPDVLVEHQARYTLKEGDFILGKIGTIGNPTLLTPPFSYAISANVILVQPKQVLPPYFFHYCQSPFVESVFKSGNVTTHAAFGIKRMRELPVPLPPLAEQRRIVAKVTELLAYCTALEAELQQARQAAEALHTAALREAFQPQAVMAAS